MNYTIRRAKPEDAAEMIRSHIRSIREVCSKDYTPEQVRVWSGKDFTIDHWHKTMQKDFVWVVEVGSEVKGFGHFSVSGGPAILCGLYFAPEARGLGAGKEIFQKMLDEAKAVNAQVIRLCATVTAKTFYERVGFRQVDGDRFVRTGGIELESFPMEYQITQ